MKIAFISTMNGSQWGGSEELWSKTALYALINGHKVIVSVYDWGRLHPQIDMLHKNGAILHLRKVFNPKQSIWNKAINHFKNKYKYLGNVYNDIFDFKPDIVLISQGESFDIVKHHEELISGIIFNKVPYSIICHSNYEYSSIPGSNIFPDAKVIFNRAERIYVVAERLLNVLQRQLCMDLQNTRFIWNPVNIKNLNPIDYPKSEIIEFAVIGYLGFSKGQDILFEILKNEKWQRRSLLLNVYGNGYGLQYLKELAKYFGIENKVVFHGYVNDMRKVWEKNHALLMGSSTEWMPLSLMEAMLCARVSIVPDIGGISQLAINNINAFISESPSLKALDSAMEIAWNNKNQWAQMGKNAHENAMSFIDLKPEETLLNDLVRN